ncbi:MAG: hypothetical protein IJA34_16350 [Lachnospiraceae bacterium]|nr:hypothetical protein [Lachnospiraceae bacterium]
MNKQIELLKKEDITVVRLHKIRKIIYVFFDLIKNSLNGNIRTTMLYRR